MTSRYRKLFILGGVALPAALLAATAAHAVRPGTGHVLPCKIEQGGTRGCGGPTGGTGSTDDNYGDHGQTGTASTGGGSGSTPVHPPTGSSGGGKPTSGGTDSGGKPTSSGKLTQRPS